MYKQFVSSSNNKKIVMQHNIGLIPRIVTKFFFTDLQLVFLKFEHAVFTKLMF